MQAGIVRRIDELGRIVIPKEMRRTMRLQVGDEMEICSDGENITLKRYSGFQSVLSEVKGIAKSLCEYTEADVLFVSCGRVIVSEGANKKHYQGDRQRKIRQNRGGAKRRDFARRRFE